MTPKLLSATSINGTPVYNLDGKHIGDINDLMIDWQFGRVGYVVLAFGGFLGFGEKLFAIPIESFSFDTGDDDERVVIDVSKASLENAPGFDKDNWPQNPDYSFIDSVHVHYGFGPYSEKNSPSV